MFTWFVSAVVRLSICESVFKRHDHAFGILLILSALDAEFRLILGRKAFFGVYQRQGCHDRSSHSIGYCWKHLPACPGSLIPLKGFVLTRHCCCLSAWRNTGLGPVFHDICSLWQSSHDFSRTASLVTLTTSISWRRELSRILPSSMTRSTRFWRN